MTIQTWSDEELDASVRAYIMMLNNEKQGIQYTKSHFRKRLLGNELSGRSDGAFEYRMQNISYVLHSLGQQYIAGYKPAKNVGPKAFDFILKSLRKNNFLDIQDFEPTPDNEDLAERTNKIRKRIDLQVKPRGQVAPKKTIASTVTIYRDPAVRAWLLENAKGKCESCDMNAPFLLPSGDAFLEIHHVKPLAEDGEDTIENAIAICPNCHRRLHFSEDRKEFTKLVYKKIERLQMNMINETR